ncbi:chromosome-associated kinesin KIF4-like [Leucoraja erinacea]|uniref:chromosome-associated kinesin KIF4-like n=1 Tax=Leucoraja erinaceus TaxID=7782 RepID=UPI002458A625|nr:chromosome-associated kinesin KIF4-like [Leucoraja erinacea]
MSNVATDTMHLIEDTFVLFFSWGGGGGQIDIFSGLDVEITFLIVVKVYNEDILDLLDTSRDKSQIHIREDPKDGIKIVGLIERTVNTAMDMLGCLEQGNSTRTVAATAMNSQSSRSHAIFTIAVEQRKKSDGNHYIRSKFHLAGSEQQRKTKAEGDRLKEGININRGLLCLGNVISALGDENNRTGFVPYRDSKLTRLLQDSLGGNSHTLMMACVSPADSNLEETLNILRYADRARKIKNKPVVNFDPQAAELQRLKQQVEFMIWLYPLVRIMFTVDIVEQVNEKLMGRLSELSKHAAYFSRFVLSKPKKSHIFAYFFDSCKLDLDQLIEISSSKKTKEQIDALRSLQQMITDLENECKELAPELEGMDVEEHMTENAVLKEKRDSDPFVASLALRQCQMYKELMELNKVLALKEKLGRKMSQSDCEMEPVHVVCLDSIKSLESEVSALQKEKEELVLALRSAKKDTNATKVRERRRKRLQELEAEMTNLKKKLIEQSKILQIKERAEGTVNKLNQEIQALKCQRVQLMRHMKEEGEKTRRLKAENDKEVIQLKEKDRKRQYELLKLERDCKQQANALIRKTEERRTFTLAELMQSTEICSPPLNEQLERVQTEVELRTAQIADLQQQLMVADNEERLKHQWDTIATIEEAKCGLKWLMKELVSSKVSHSQTTSALNQTIVDGTELQKNVFEEQNRITEMETEHQQQLLEQEQRHREKV